MLPLLWGLYHGEAGEDARPPANMVHSQLLLDAVLVHIRSDFQVLVPSAELWPVNWYLGLPLVRIPGREKRQLGKGEIYAEPSHRLYKSYLWVLCVHCGRNQGFSMCLCWSQSLDQLLPYLFICSMFLLFIFSMCVYCVLMFNPYGVSITVLYGTFQP